MEREDEVNPALGGVVAMLSGRKPPTSAPDMAQLTNLIFAGSHDLGDYINHFTPVVETSVMLSRLGPAGEVTRSEYPLRVTYGGGAGRRKGLDPATEITASFTRQVLVANATDRDGRPALLETVVLGAVAAELLGPMAPVNVEQIEARNAYRSSLVNGGAPAPMHLKLVEGGAEASLPATLRTADQTTPALEAALFPGVATVLSKAALADLRKTALVALLGNTDAPDFTGWLRQVQQQCRQDIAKALTRIEQEQQELRQGWTALLLLHGAGEQPVPVADVPTSWLLSEPLTIRGPVALPWSAQEYTLRRLVTPRDNSDQSNVLGKVVLVEPVEDPAALQQVGTWAEALATMIYANLAASDLDGLAAATEGMQRGTPQKYGQSVFVLADALVVPLEGGNVLTIPAAVLAAAAQTVQDTQPAQQGEAVSGVACAAVGHSKPLTGLPDRAMIAIRAQHTNGTTGRVIGLDDGDLIRRCSRGIAAMPVKRDGMADFALNEARTLFRAGNPDDPERAFESVAASRTRNFVIRSIDRYLRRHVLQRAVDEKLLGAQQRGLNAWLATLDDTRTGRRLIEPGHSNIRIAMENGELRVDVTIAYKPTVERHRITDSAATDHLRFQFDKDANNWKAV